MHLVTSTEMSPCDGSCHEGLMAAFDPLRTLERAVLEGFHRAHVTAKFENEFNVSDALGLINEIRSSTRCSLRADEAEWPEIVQVWMCRIATLN